MPACLHPATLDGATREHLRRLLAPTEHLGLLRAITQRLLDRPRDNAGAADPDGLLLILVLRDAAALSRFASIEGSGFVCRERRDCPRRCRVCLHVGLSAFDLDAERGLLMEKRFVWPDLDNDGLAGWMNRSRAGGRDRRAFRPFDWSAMLAQADQRRLGEPARPAPTRAPGVGDDAPGMP